MISPLPERIVHVDISSEKHPHVYMIVDEAFYQRFCCPRKWCLDGKTGYAVAKMAGKKVDFHRVIMQGDGTKDVDHINGDKLDNRIANLRYVSHGTNVQNQGPRPGSSSRYKGVHLVTKGETPRYYASIRVNDRNIHIGSFTDEIEAAKAYNREALKAHGPYAWVNRFEEVE